jgi:hypothetical protein
MEAPRKADPTYTGGAITFTVQVAVMFPSTVVAVMFAVPTFLAVTNPLELTVATCKSLVFHSTFLLVASVGSTVTATCPVVTI